MKEKVLVLLLVAVVAHALPTTIVNFSPVGDSPNVAPGFAYAFRASEPLGGPEAPVYLDETIASTNEAPPKVVKTQYHSQDQLGQYAFGYVGDSSTKHEVRTADGAVRGSFTYLDSAGVLQTANYVADKNGYRVEASNLPQGPNDVATGPVAPGMEAPKPVQYTPEVLAARNAHLKAFEAVKAAAAAAQARAAAKAATKKEATITRSKRSYPAAGYLPPPPPPKETKKYIPLLKNSKTPVKHFVAPIPLVHPPHNHDPHTIIFDGHIVHTKTPAPELRNYFLKETKSKDIKTPKIISKHIPTKQIPLDGHFVHAPLGHIIHPVHSVHDLLVHKPIEKTREVLLDGHIVHAPVPLNTLLPPAVPTIHSLPANNFVTPVVKTRQILLDGHIVHAPVPINSLLPPVHKEVLHVTHPPVQQTREVFLDGHVIHAPIPVNTLLPPVNSAPSQHVHTPLQHAREVIFDGQIVKNPVPINSLPPVHSASVQNVPAPIHQTKEILLDGHILHYPVPVNTLTVPNSPSSLYDSSIDYLDMPFKKDPIPTPLTNQAVFVKAEPELLKAIKLAAPSLEIPLAAPLGTQVAQQVLSQFHSQDELGGFEFGYSGGPSSRHEIRDHAGITRGSYSYVDANGELQSVQYIADDFNGFRVQATNLPEDPASITA